MKPRIKYWPEAGCWMMEAAKGRKFSKEEIRAFQNWADKVGNRG